MTIFYETRPATNDGYIKKIYAPSPCGISIVPHDSSHFPDSLVGNVALLLHAFGEIENSKIGPNTIWINLTDDPGNVSVLYYLLIELEKIDTQFSQDNNAKKEILSYLCRTYQIDLCEREPLKVSDIIMEESFRRFRENPSLDYLRQVARSGFILNNPELHVLLHQCIARIIKERIDQEKRECGAPNLILALRRLLEFVTTEKVNIYFPRMDKLAIVFELFQHVTKQVYPNSEDTYLCGISVLISSLIHGKTDLFVEMALSLAQNGTIERPLQCSVHLDSKENDFSIVSALIQSIRLSANWPDDTEKNSRFAGEFQTITTPKLLASLLEKCTFNVLTETTLLEDSSGCELSLPLRSSLGGVYSDKHTKLHADINLLETIGTQLKRGCLVIFYVSVNFGQNSDEASRFRSFSSVRIGHYIYVHSLSLSKSKSQVDIIFETTGEKEEHTFPVNTFLEHYRGALIFDSADDVNQLNHDNVILLRESQFGECDDVAPSASVAVPTVESQLSGDLDVRHTSFAFFSAGVADKDGDGSHLTTYYMALSSTI